MLKLGIFSECALSFQIKNGQCSQTLAARYIFLMDQRVDKKRRQLLKSEQSKLRERALFKRLGRVMPEDTIKVPKIGEWSLSESNNVALLNEEDQVKKLPKRVVPFPRSIPLNTAQRKRLIMTKDTFNAPIDDPQARPRTSAPYILKPPRIITLIPENIEPKVTFPDGTVTTNLDDILKSKYREMKRALPPLKGRGKDEKVPFMPLEIFDDSTYEEYPLEVLMKDPRAFSRYQDIDGENYWAACHVISYDPETSLFLIEWDATHNRKKVARFNLRFARENEEKFEKRIEAAKLACTKYETRLRLEVCINSMPMDQLPVLSKDDIESIHARMDVKMKDKYLRVLKKLDQEVGQQFRVMNNVLDFFYQLDNNPLIPERNDFLLLKPVPPPVPYSALVDHPEYNFAETLQIISERHLMGQPHIQHGLYKIWRIFQDSRYLSFLDQGYNEMMELDAFVSKEIDHMTETAKNFKGSIQSTLEGVITATLSEQMNSSKARDKERYEGMVNLTTMMLHTVLMSIVESTLGQYTGLYTHFLEARHITEKRDPQFLVDFKFLNHSELNFSPTIDEFKDKLLGILLRLEETVKDLPVIKSALFEVDSAIVSFDDCCHRIITEKDTLGEILNKLFVILEQFLSDRKFLSKVLSLDTENYTHDFDPKGLKTLGEYRKQLDEFHRILDIIQNEMKPTYTLDLFYVSCEEFKETSITHIKTLIHNFLSQVKRYALKDIDELKTEFETIIEKIQKVPETPEELAAMKKYLEQVYDSVKTRAKKMNFANERFAFLEEYQFEVTNEEFQFRYQTLQMPQKISMMMEDTERTLSVERIRMIRELKANEKRLETETNELSEALASFSAKFNDLDMTVEAIDQVNEIAAKLQKLKKEQQIFNNHEKLFDFEQVTCRTLIKVDEEFAPLYLLWTLANDWLQTSTTWLTTPFPQIRADSLNQWMGLAGKKLTKLKKDLAQQHLLMEKVLTPLAQQIDAFKQDCPLITRLRHPGIKTKHWEQISEIVGFAVVPSMEWTLQDFLDLHLERWNDQITEIASVAANEYALELSLDQMDADLQQKQFITVEFRDSGHFILHEIDDISSTIDDQLVTAQTLLTSPFIAPVKKRATEKLAFLKNAREILDRWIECQRSWLYLQPIFSGTSIQQKLHKEARDWAAVDQLWTATMTMTHAHPEFSSVMHRDALKPNLEQCCILLDSITKGLNAYLEAKRLGFPRFFFLSNDELISILSHTKDFGKMQDSMQKLFEYVNSITVTEDMEITHMNDAEGEQVMLMNPVNGNTPEIEDWLNAFEEEMKNTIKEYTADSLEAITKKARKKWIADFPAQVILIANQILWTQQVTSVLQGQKLRGLKVLQRKFLEQLDELTTLVRQPISRLLRQVVSCMLINEVHNRDIVAELVSNEVSDEENFKWIQQLRYYWEDETIMVRSINNTFEFSYEYAGNSARLVITPLTDRCYQTLLSAFKQNLSGAPSGPAGTGKTETARDCAKALGRPCVVYNCSEEVTPEQMSQFFAGLASSGSWCCFDEFNRINIEVLSVIAQQVRSIQTAIAANASTFVLDQRTLKLNTNAAIVITMNPGYAGRTELPDNLKALFRPCAMMVPDFVFISEIMLFSGGFTTASALSVKLVALFDLCRKQLSSANHYDWGLRAMKAILSTAGKAKRNDLKADESVLLLQVIRECTAPRLISDDLPLFAGIINDVFPEVTADKTQPEELSKHISNAFVNHQLDPIPFYVTKGVELYETTVVRHGIMLVGGAMGGKSISWKMLAGALTSQASEGEGKPVHIEFLNPKAITIGELYGAFNPVTSEWADGVLSKAIRECSFSEQTELKWIIVDGPVDSLWIESMNSLLDDNKVLCLPNNERIQLGPHVKMVFEVDDLSQASPATVSRCGMVYFDPSTLPWTALVHSWSKKYIETEEIMTNHVVGLMKAYFPSLIKFMKVDAQCALPINPNFCVSATMKILDSYMDILRKPEEKVSETSDEVIKVDPLDQPRFFSLFSQRTGDIPFLGEGQITMGFERIFMFAAIWGFGGVLTDESRKTFDPFFRELMKKNESNTPLPIRGSVFELFPDLSRNEWVPFCDGNTSVNFTEERDIEEQLIPTNENAGPMFIARLLLNSHMNVMFMGPESSKTLIAKTLFNTVLDKTRFDCHVLPLACCSAPTNISRFMQSFMHKRQGKWGPLPNQHLIFLIDNMGAVKPEVYGAQPPLELLRQFSDYGGWFQTSPVEFFNIIGTTLIGTMGQPGGGLFGIPQRLMRHFVIVHIPKYDQEVILNIVKQMMRQRFKAHGSCVKDSIDGYSNATVDAFMRCRETLLPIPSKLHYIFNLRGIIRVLKGMLMMPANLITNESMLLRLWHHEMLREYHDKFNSAEDRNWFIHQLKELSSKYLKMSFKSVCPSGFNLFNAFSDGSQKYKDTEVTQDQLLQMCNNILDEHNRDAEQPIDIVLFQEAISHLSSLSRVFSMERGHTMLVGVKSSGRKSLARLALHMASIDTFQITITRSYGVTEWREDIKNLLKQCGVQDIATGFIITDTQIMMNTQLEDLQNLLINGQIPQLYERDEFEAIKAELAASEVTFMNDINFGELFYQRVKKNLHIILVFSPFGSVFKDSMLSFTALRNETTIDWYMPWSQDALESVAHASLVKAKIGENSTIESIVSVCVQIHKSVEGESQRFLKETKRFTAVTPSRYFELLSTLIKKFKAKSDENANGIRDYENGVEKIISTRTQIQAMSEQLDRDIPVLQQTRAEVEQMMKELTVKRGEVEETRREVQGKSEIAEREAAQAAETNRIAQEQLEMAQPILEEAQEAVQRLDKNSLVEIKKLHQPSSGMVDTFEAVCILFGRNPRKIDGPNPGEKIDSYWPEAVALLNDVQFIKNVQGFKPETIPKPTIEKLRKYCPANPQVRAEKRKAALASFQAVAALYDWVCASFDYWFVYQEILPKKLAAEEAERKLAESMEILSKAKEHLAAVEAKLQELQRNFQQMQNKEAELTESVGNTRMRLQRAQKIMSGLSGETTRWSECAEQLKGSAHYILGDSLLIAGVLTYLGAFSPAFRSGMIELWKTFLQKENISFTSTFTIEKALGNDGIIRDWIVKGLPNDTHSIENALIITQHDHSFPLLIDPQLSGTRWLRAVEGEKMVVLRFDQSDFLQRLRSCVSFGLPVLIENVGLKLDPLIDPILSGEIINIDGMKRISLGGEYVTYMDSFRMYISTKYPNPQYSPEVCSQVTLINFTTTQDGLTDLLLNNLIEVERSDLDKERVRIMEANAENVKKLKEIEKEILAIVSNAGSDILDDDVAIDTLTRAQKTSANIEQQMAASKKTEEMIAEFKENYSVVAERAALLYFCVSDFSVIDPMYQFSLKWFVSLFRNAIVNAEHPDEHDRKVEAFHSAIAKTFYQAVSYSLFSRHKLLFSTLMVFRIMMSERKIAGGELAFLLSPILGRSPNPTNYIPDDVWSLVSSLPMVSPAFHGIIEHIEKNEAEWRQYIESRTPENDKIPFNKELTPFQEFLLLRVFHLQRVREGLHNFIANNFGPEFVKPPTLNLMNVFKDSDPLTPLIFIIMPGIDPQDEIILVADAMETSSYLKSYSLGRGRGQGAEELILDSAEKGFWVLLQNCHLSLSWMPKLEHIINNLDPAKTHPRFKLCLVTMSSPDFPIGILYQGTKLIYEIPKGMRENVMRIYSSINSEEYDAIDNATPEKQLTFHLAFFHAVVLERLQFGSIGWNIPYEFNPSDFTISRRHLRLFLNEAAQNNADIPFEALDYVIGELNYGGRVTDRWDRRLLLSLLKRFFSKEVNSPTFSFGENYTAPNFDATMTELMDTVATWPVVTQGEDVGLSRNASTITARNEANRIFASLIEVQPTLVAASDSISEEQFAINFVESLLKQVPQPFNLHSFLNRFDVQDTINIVLHHEILLYNKLLEVIRDSLEEMERGLKGLIVIDERLELLNRRLLANKIPEMWMEFSFPSILPLRRYMDDLRMRVAFLDKWIRTGAPVVFNLGAFYHPEEFLTAVLQVYARKHVVPFDTLRWKTTALEHQTGARIQKPPEEGIYIEGLPMEGAKWSAMGNTLVECGQRELVSILPVLHLLPTQEQKPYDMSVTYECPVYRTQNRGSGAMGLQNYIFSLFLPTKDNKPDHWVQRSVAAFITT